MKEWTTQLSSKVLAEVSNRATRNFLPAVLGARRTLEDPSSLRQTGGRTAGPEPSRVRHGNPRW